MRESRVKTPIILSVTAKTDWVQNEVLRFKLTKKNPFIHPLTTLGSQFAMLPCDFWIRLRGGLMSRENMYACVPTTLVVKEAQDKT